MFTADWLCIYDYLCEKLAYIMWRVYSWLAVYLWLKRWSLTAGWSSCSTLYVYIPKSTTSVCIMLDSTLPQHSSYTSWKVLDFFLDFPGPGKSWKISLDLEIKA